jgi:hypothetical protein
MRARVTVKASCNTWGNWMIRCVVTAVVFLCTPVSTVATVALGVLVLLSAGNAFAWRQFSYRERDMRLWWALFSVQCALLARAVSL